MTFSKFATKINYGSTYRRLLNGLRINGGVGNHKSRIINQAPWREPGLPSSLIPLKREIRYVCKLFDIPRSCKIFGKRNESLTSRRLVNAFIHSAYKETTFLCYVISIGASGSQGCMSHLWFVIHVTSPLFPLRERFVTWANNLTRSMRCPMLTNRYASFLNLCSCNLLI